VSRGERYDLVAAAVQKSIADSENSGYMMFGNRGPAC